MAAKKGPSPRRMPGDVLSPSPGGMRNYVVLLKEEDVPDSNASQVGDLAAGRRQEHPEKRSLVLEAGTLRTAEFQRKLQQFLKEQGVADRVGRIGEPSVFPIVALTCTPEVASLIQTLPEVEAVVPDREEMHLLP